MLRRSGSRVCGPEVAITRTPDPRTGPARRAEARGLRRKLYRLYQRKGLYPVTFRALGLEGAGEVDAVGEGAKTCRKGTTLRRESPGILSSSRGRPAENMGLSTHAGRGAGRRGVMIQG